MYFLSVGKVHEGADSFERQYYYVKILNEDVTEDGQQVLFFRHIYKSKYDNSCTSMENTVYLDSGKYEEIKGNQLNMIGSTLEIYGKYEPLVSPSNPGAANVYIQNLAYKRIGKFRLKEIRVVDLESQKELTGLLSLSNYISNSIYQLYEGNTMGLVKAMILGDKSDISDDYKETFKQHGVSHIIAISGLHISILYMVISKIIYVLLRKPEKTFWVTSGLMFMYNLLIGFNVSCIRASVMMTMYAISVIYLLPYDKQKCLMFTFSLYVIFRPWDIFNLGFILSYLAVWSLFYLYPILTVKIIGKKLNYQLKDYLSFILVTVAINIGTFPVLVYYFGGISLTSVIGNLLVVPLVFFIYIGSLISVVLFSFVQPIAFFLSGSVEVMAKYYDVVFELLKRIKFMYLPRPTLLEIGLYYVLLLLFIKLNVEKTGIYEN